MKTVTVRLGVSDILITKEQEEKAGSYVQLFDREGNLIGEAETYLVGYEDEEGNECDEDGEILTFD